MPNLKKQHCMGVVLLLATSISFAKAPNNATKIHQATASELQYLSKQVLDLPNGDPRVLLAFAAKYGQARGVITGKAAQVIKTRTGSDAQVNVYAKNLGEVPKQPGCKKIRLTYSSSIPHSKNMSIDMAVCPKLAAS